MAKITVPLSVAGINQLQTKLEEYRKCQQERAKELARRLADLGVSVAKIGFENGSHLGERDENVVAEETENGFKVRAYGKTVLFVEFGAGITYGSGHPEAQEFGMGAGTYPDGKGHWNDPDGWYLPKSAGGGHTYGNPPAMPMYEARKQIEQELPRIVKEVFTR
jgi:hypothetical protein